MPEANVAVATGPVSGVIVIDVDGDAGRASLAALESANGPLPVTWRTITARGFHTWFADPAAPIGVSAGKLGSGLDVRARGGYVVGPGSAHPSGARYRWADDADPARVALAPLPGWLLDRLLPRPAPPRDCAPIATPITAGGAYARRALEGELARVLAAPIGQRNVALNRAAFALAQLIAAGALDKAAVIRALAGAGARVGLDPREIGRTIESGLSAGIQQPRDLRRAS